MIYKRNLQLPFMGVFDAPDALLSCPRREQSTHAPQALEMLNGATSNQLAEVFAAAASQGSRRPTLRGSIWPGVWLSGRPPTPKEKALALQYLAEKPG